MQFEGKTRLTTDVWSRIGACSKFTSSMLKTNVHISDSWVGYKPVCVCACVRAPLRQWMPAGFVVFLAGGSVLESIYDHGRRFRMELDSGVHHRRALLGGFFFVPWHQKLKKKKITLALKYQAAAVGSGQKEWSVHTYVHAHIQSHSCCKTALFFHNPSARNKQHFVRRKVFIQQGIKCIFISACHCL